MISAEKKFQLNNWDGVAQAAQVGTLLRQKKGVIKAIYDVANVKQGGAVGAIDLLDEDGNPVVLPKDAIITQVYCDVITAFVSTSNDGTIALTANSSGDLLVAVDADTKSGVFAGVPVGTGATMVKLTAERTLKVEVATHPMTSGKLHVFVDFVLSAQDS